MVREDFSIDLVVKKLEGLLQERNYPLPIIGVEAADPWFVGIGEFPNVLRYLLANLCHEGFGLVSIDGVAYFAFIDQERWDATIGEAGRLLESGVGKRWSADYCRSVVAGLLPEKCREFRSILWDKASHLCHFTTEGNDEAVLTSYGPGAEHVVEAVLAAAEQPLHFTAISTLATDRAGRSIDVRRAHNAAASVGLLLGRGIFGLERHLPLSQDALVTLGEEAEEIVAGGPIGRQWHSSEILSALVELGSQGALEVDKYIIDIALQRSGSLERLGRMMWVATDLSSEQEISRIDVRQAVITILRKAGRPLRTNEIRQRLVALRGVNEYLQIAAIDPVIRVGTALWGLNDVTPIKRADHSGS